jgi:thiamine pyrophosphokinase
MREVSARLLDPRSRISLLTAPDALGREVTGTFQGRAGDVISLLPMGANVVGLTTRGLAYPLFEETLALGPARGLSNVRTEATATVSVRDGRLLVIESPATLPP